MDDQHAVGGAAHIELDRVAAQRRGQAERLDGVLAARPRGAPVSEYLLP